MPNDAYDEVQKVYPQAHQNVAGIYDRDPTNLKQDETCAYLGKDWNDARSHLLPAHYEARCSDCGAKWRGATEEECYDCPQCHGSGTKSIIKLPARQEVLGTCDLHGLEHPESIWCVRWTPLPAQQEEAAQPPQAEPDELPDWCRFVCPACKVLAGQPCINGASCMERVLLQGLAEPPPEARFHYSGKGSRQFWKRVNRIEPHGVKMALYVAGCGLQEHENRMHQALQQAEEDMRKGGVNAE